MTFPSIVGDTGLMVTWTVDEPGRPSDVIDLTTWPGAETLRREAARGIAVRVGPTGTWTAREGVRRAMFDVRALLRWCELNEVESFADLTEARWQEWDRHLHDQRTERGRLAVLMVVRSFLLGVETLPQRSRWAISQRIGTAADQPQPTYNRADFRALERAAHRTMRIARKRISGNLELAHAQPTDLRDDKARVKSAVIRGWLDGTIPLPRECRSDLMLTAAEAVAAATLMTCKEGFNLSTLCRLRVADNTASQGDVDFDIYTADLDKPRRGPARRHFPNVWPDDGQADSMGRIYRLVEECTEPARIYLATLGEPSDLLLLYGSDRDEGRWYDGGEDYSTAVAPGVFGGVPSAGVGNVERRVDPSEPPLRNGRTRLPNPRRWADWLPEGVQVNFQMLHRTYQTIINPAPTHNTRSTHVNSYLLLNETARAQARETAAAGLQHALDRAEERLILHLSEESEVDENIRSGANDTATVACVDILHHPVTGEPCKDNFLMCLMCRNAVATPRHLPRLCLLLQAFEDLRSTLTVRAWERWDDDYLRLHVFLFNRARLTEEGRVAALSAATETDKHYVRLLLGGTYDTPE